MDHFNITVICWNLLLYDACSTIIHALLFGTTFQWIKGIYLKYLRINVRASWQNRHAENSFEKLHWLEIQDRIIYTTWTLTYKSDDNIATSYVFVHWLTRKKSCEYSVGNWSSSALLYRQLVRIVRTLFWTFIHLCCSMWMEHIGWIY